MGKHRKIDKIDVTILKALLKDARTSFVEIAKDCAVHPNLIRTHYNRLKQDGIITGEITEMNPQSFGYKFFAYGGLRVDPDKMARVISKLEKIPTIMQTAEGVGGRNILCFIIARDIPDLNKTITQLREIEGVTAVDSNPVIQTNRTVFPENLQIAEEEQDGRN
ncbi:MAG: Lrp/AsnC family transcriptional regulator [Candidatus Bathyarchaeia archaeon]